jgi:SAM-dependent methyltransferase
MRQFLPALREQAGLDTALDVGCGVGYFSTFLHKMGFRVVGSDGRKENVQECQRRFPDIQFHTADIEDTQVIGELGRFDFVLCEGLLYHLENPFLAIRNLYLVTEKVALVGGMCIPGERPILELRDEPSSEGQGLTWLGFYPTESCLVKMLYKAGFPFVYRLTRLPEHEDYRETLSLKRVRAMLVASKVALDSTLLCLVGEPTNSAWPWQTRWGKALEPLKRVWRFLRKPWPQKLATVHKYLSPDT